MRKVFSLFKLNAWLFHAPSLTVIIVSGVEMFVLLAKMDSLLRMVNAHPCLQAPVVLILVHPVTPIINVLHV